MQQPLKLLVVYEGQRSPAELLSLLAAGSHVAMPVAGLDSAVDTLSSQRYAAVLLASDYDEATLESFAFTLKSLDAGFAAGARRTVLLSCAQIPPDTPAIDLHLSIPDDFAELAPIVEELASFRVLSSEPSPEPVGQLSVFEPSSFEEQCAHDSELMVEILDLFSAECDQELPVIAACIASRDFERASRVAHSLKGSLGSLYAASARRQAQDLELAARVSDAAACSRSLEALSAEIHTLRSHLLEFRQTSLSR